MIFMAIRGGEVQATLPDHANFNAGWVPIKHLSVLTSVHTWEALHIELSIFRRNNRMLSAEKERNRGHLIQDTGNASQPGGPEGPEDFQLRNRDVRCPIYISQDAFL